MPNGDNLLGGNLCDQPVFVVPSRSVSSEYYLFTVDEVHYFQAGNGLRVSVVDMNLNGGLGDISPGRKNIPLPLGDSCKDNMSGIRHANNKDAWLVVRRRGMTGRYQSYLVDGAGISNNPVISQSNLATKIGTIFQRRGSIRISPDGLNLVCGDSLAELCYFNPQTGQVTSRFLFGAFEADTLNSWISSFEFSVDSKYLYVGKLCSSWSCSQIYQYDLSKTDSSAFMQSQVRIGNGYGHMQMGPDWKIYVKPVSYIDSL